MNIIKILLILCIISTLAGCVSESTNIPKQETSRAVLSMKEFSDKHNLEVENYAGGYLFTRQGVRLQLFPGLNYLRYNGKTIRITDAPFVSNGELFLPLSLISSLPDSFSPREQAVSSIFVLLDPGHGGEDTGAISGKAFEKDIVLDIARRVQQRLNRAGIASQLTRDADYFITLDERSKIANRHPGAIFVSIHANAETTGNVQGIETFYLTSKISDKQRAEWASDAYDFNTADGSLNPKMELIAAEKMSYGARNDSKTLARFVQNTIISDLGEPSRGVKQENFSVLRESFFGPAILVETGFVTNAQSRSKLLNYAYRQKMAESIANGILKFIQSKN